MPGTLPILTYHSLDDSGSVVSTHPGTFARHMARIDELGFRGISLREAARSLHRSGTWPARTVALTFDDGFENLLAEALPVLDHHGFSATAYIVSGHVAGHNDWAQPPAGLGARKILDWAQVAELAAAGWEIGAHTRTHPDLRTLSGEGLEQEIVASRCRIEDRLGQAVESFAYPFGYSSATAAEIVSREFATACTTELRFATAEPLHALPRIDVFYLQKAGRMRRLLAGRLDGFLTLRRWGRRAKAAWAG